MKFLFLILFVFISPPLHAEELVNYNNSVRALGMGNAFATVVDDKNALWYNPAGLGKIKGINLTIMDPYVGADGMDVIQSVQNASSSGSGSSFADTLQQLYGKNVWVGAGAHTALAFPGFALAAYDNVDVAAYLSNPAFPKLRLRYTNDIGFAAGFGVDAGGIMQFGISGERITRSGASFPIGMTTLGSLSNQQILDQISNRGTGYAAHMGINFSIPSPVKPSFAFVWKNMGQTYFSQDSGTSTPPPILDEMVFGFGISIDSALVDIRPALEVKHINRSAEPLGKKIHMGVEIDLPVASLRAGLNQGYYTAGAGVDLSVFRLDVATYGVELGEYPGQREDRRYLVQFTAELGFDPNFNFLGGGSGGSKRRIKLRR